MMTLQHLLPELAGLLMLWAGLVSLAGEELADMRTAMLRQSEGQALPPDRVIHVIHVASLTLAAVLAGVVTRWWQYPTTVAALRLVLAALLVWTVGDLAPRLLAVLAPELIGFARRTVLASSSLFSPLLWMARRFDRATGSDHPLTTPLRSAATHEMALGVFSLKEMTVAEVMTPRIDVVSVDVAVVADDVVEVLRQSEHSRLLVSDGGADAVVGIIYAKDMLARIAGDDNSRQAWQRLIRPARFVPEGKTLERQLRDFQLGSGHIAVVVDEYGGTAGLITLEDILEQIVGEIQDEYDDDEATPVVRHDDGHLTVQGGVPLADLEAEIGHEFEREDVATVGGLALAELGHVPRAGERFTLDQWRFTVELVIRRRVRRVSVWPPAGVAHEVSSE